MSIIFSLIIFSKPICYASITILTLGDGSAMIFGRIFGRTVLPFNKHKRVEGSLFGFILGFMGALVFVSPKKALIGATVGMFVEIFPISINDNLTVPIASGIATIIL